MLFRLAFLAAFLLLFAGAVSGEQAPDIVAALVKRGFTLDATRKSKDGKVEIRLYVLHAGENDLDAEYGKIEQAVVAIHDGRTERIPSETWPKVDQDTGKNFKGTDSADIRGSASDLYLSDDGRYLVRSQTFGHGIMDAWLYHLTPSGAHEVRFQRENFHHGAWIHCKAISKKKPPKSLDDSSQMLNNIVWEKGTHRLEFEMYRKDWSVLHGDEFSFSAVYDADKNRFRVLAATVLASSSRD
jgi:hypothetical protein